MTGRHDSLSDVTNKVTTLTRGPGKYSFIGLRQKLFAITVRNGNVLLLSVREFDPTKNKLNFAIKKRNLIVYHVAIFNISRTGCVALV